MKKTAARTHARGHKRAKTRKGAPPTLNPIERDPSRNPALHRRILDFLNAAVSPEDLMYERTMVVHAEGGLGHQGNPVHEDNPEAMKMDRDMVMTRDIAKRLFEFREAEFPLGFRNIKEILDKFD